MKKITLGLAVLMVSLMTNSYAGSSASQKNEVSIPCYNSGLNFGLAAYSTDTLNSTTESNRVNTQDSHNDRDEHKGNHVV